MTALLAGEILKLRRQPAALFFGFFAMSVLMLLFKLGLEGFTFLRMGGYPIGEVDLLFSAAKAMSISGNTLSHLIYAIGIGTVFVTEYRWTTWRLLVPRHARLQLYATKFLACLVFIALSLVVTGLGDLAINLFRAALHAQPGTSLAIRGTSAGLLILAFLSGLLELSVLAAFVALITTIFRSMMPAVILAFLLVLGSSILQLYLGRDADRWPLPNYCAEFLRNWITGNGIAAQAGVGAFFLLLWLVVLFALGAAWFQRQELNSE